MTNAEGGDVKWKWPQVGNHTLTACPYCDLLLDGSSLEAVLKLHDAHLESSPECKAQDAAKPPLSEVLDGMAEAFCDSDAKYQGRLDSHPDNGRAGFWRVVGIRHEATTKASTAREAVQKCIDAGAVGSWESADAVFLGEELPDVF